MTTRATKQSNTTLKDTSKINWAGNNLGTGIDPLAIVFQILDRRVLREDLCIDNHVGRPSPGRSFAAFALVRKLTNLIKGIADSVRPQQRYLFRLTQSSPWKELSNVHST